MNIADLRKSYERAALSEDGDILLMPPTLVCLEELAATSTVSAALAVDPTIAPVMPVLVDTDAGPAMRVQLP